MHFWTAKMNVQVTIHQAVDLPMTFNTQVETAQSITA